MKAVNYNKKLYIGKYNKELRPFSVNSFSHKKYISPIRPLFNDINYPYYNKNNFSNNRIDNSISELNVYSDHNFISPKNNEIFSEIKASNNKQNYENLNVRIFNLYNIKDKNREFSIRINNSSPKYYINNCVNQLLLKNANEKNSNKNEIIQLNERASNNPNNIKQNKFIFSLISPKNKEHRKINFSKNKNDNLLNSKTIKKNDNQRKNNQIMKKRTKNIFMNDFDNLYYSNKNLMPFDNTYNYNSIFQEKNLDDIYNRKHDKFGQNFDNYSQINHINNIKNKNNKNICINLSKPNLTIENQKFINKYFKNSPKNTKIQRVKLTSPLNSKKLNKNGNNNIILNKGKKSIKKIENENKAFNTIFDLRNNYFESETIKNIINEFFENEKKELEKKVLVEKINKSKKTNNIKNTIPHQKPKFQKITKNNEIIKVPQKVKKLTNKNYEIYLQYGQNNNVEKILLNDKNGNITSFFASIENDKKVNTLDNS